MQRRLVLAGLFILLLLVLIVDIMLGSVAIPANEVLNALFSAVY